MVGNCKFLIELLVHKFLLTAEHLFAFCPVQELIL